VVLLLLLLLHLLLLRHTRSLLRLGRRLLDVLLRGNWMGRGGS
jgi:hypothetical protein